MISKKDLLILSHLRKNARISLTKLSKQTSIPVSTIFDRLRAQKNTFNLRHSTLLNFNQLGFNTKATVLLKIERQDKNKLRDFLSGHANVNSLYKVNNGYDFLIDCVFVDMKALDSFLDMVEQQFCVEDKNVYYIVDDIKREAFLSDPQSVHLLLHDYAAS